MIKLGKKIRYFRKRGGLSQFKLEDLIGASAGSLSRIENGEVNPTKETVEKIVLVLNLNSREESYLSGKVAMPATDNLVKKVTASITDYSSKRGAFLYLIDERWRILYASNSFLKIVGYSNQEDFLQRAYKKTIPQLIIDPEIGIRKLFDKDNYEELLNVQLRQYYFEVGFMKDDYFYLQTEKTINSDLLAKKIWKEISSLMPQKPAFLSKIESNILFNFHGVRISMRYSRQPLFDYPNFEIIEYYIENPILRKLNKLFNL